ncbi:MAG TPA: AAA family ATPase [Candidatus Acidoferrales bacterium]|nr:AAA family ATPase [Candidatus Acidoferrales bacterium]
MRLKKAHVTKYRSVRDSEWFEVEHKKTIFVGPNEAGKTALLQALQQIGPPDGVRKLDALRDYPRSEYNDITTGNVRPQDVTVAEAHFSLEDDDKAAIPAEFREATYVRGRKLDNSPWHNLEGGPPSTTYGSIKKDLARLAAHADSNLKAPAEGQPAPVSPSTELNTITQGWLDAKVIKGDVATKVEAWLKKVLALVDEKNQDEENRHERLSYAIQLDAKRDLALKTLDPRTPVFVLFSNYFRVRPIIHLEHLAHRIETNVLDDKWYDYGNECLLRLLGFSARELSNLGKAPEPARGDAAAFQKYRDQLDQRSYQLNAASVRLTEAINRVWVPDAGRDEADRLRIVADGQYLKVVVEDELGVEIELDQRSEGYQWLVSFFVVFFAESAGKHKNAILLLDEPGLSLHGLKQREFRQTISLLAETNQTLYTTHSPFLVGPSELDLVRVVEMSDRTVGTKVHTTITASDPAALLPLQEALGYDLAQSLFAQQQNLVLEGLTDYWYIDAVAQLLRDAGIVDLRENIALQPAGDAGKVVYYATILHAQKLKVAALLDSDAAGDQAANQDVLVHTLGNKAILRTKDAYTGAVKRPEIEDMLRSTLVTLAREKLGWDVTATAAAQPARPIVDIFNAESPNFSKYRLAKAFLRWTREHAAGDLTGDERHDWQTLIESIKAALN